MTRPAIVGLVALLLVGCAPGVKRVHFVPPKDHAKRAVEADVAGCERGAEGVKDEAIVFAACLIARGYLAFVIVDGAGEWVGGQPRVPVRAVQPRDAASVASDLRGCYEASKRTTGERVGEALIGIPAFVVVGGNVVERFESCLGPRGYVVDRSVPTPKTVSR
jgi:hypothetical protein